MCDERGKLIDYVYDEVSAGERRDVKVHLEGCPECRLELAALERTRQDLLAWNVPKHEPIWRPMPAPDPRSVWQQIPAWAVAAAASLVFTAGVGGGLVVRWLRPAPTAVATSAPVPAVQTVDVAALEARILDRVRSEVRHEFSTFRATFSPGPARSAVDARRAEPVIGLGLDAVARRLAELEAWRDDQIGLNYAFDNRLGGLNQRTTRLGNQFSLLQQVAYAEPR
jgi:anti-sigma factor RsiW